MTTNLDVINSVPRVATLIYQTHQLWQEFRGVPDGISGLVEHLKALEPIFAEIEDHFNEDNVSASFKNCLDMSKKAHDSLGVLVADMRTQLQAKKSIKRKYAAVKIMLNKSVVERLEQSMSRCMTFLQLAIQAYQMAMLRKLSSQVPAARVQPQRHTLVGSSRQSLPLLLQDKKMPQFQNDVDEFFPRSKKAMERSKKMTNLLTFDISQYARFALTYTNGVGGWKAQLQLPSWISTSVYEFISAPAIAGWTYSYRVYNIIADDSELVRKIICGDLIGVRQMFSSRNASPFDRTADGRSLLHYAATNQQYEICQLLLQLGLVSLLDYTSGNSSPIDSIASKMFSIQSAPPEKNLQMIAELFASYLQEPDSLPAERLLDFIRSFAPDDKLLHHFRNLFMPKYYLRPLRDRLEAVRLGAFNVIDCRTLKGLLSEDRNITKHSVAQSSCEKVSLVHSAALAMGCRYPERLNKCMKPYVWMRTYDEDWAQLVIKTAQFATLEDLTCVETVVPWDAYEVTAWRGTPLSSVIGGALCYLCPDTPVNHWDAYFNGCLQQWLTLLESAGVDLLAYGRRELLVLHGIENNTKGAFDADAIENSRTMLRHNMRKGEPLPKVNRITRTDMSSEHYWVPLRIIDLEIGVSPGDWKLKWATEYEFMACQFWRTIENKKEVVMPGAWVDCQDDY